MLGTQGFPEAEVATSSGHPKPCNCLWDQGLQLGGCRATGMHRCGIFWLRESRSPAAEQPVLHLRRRHTEAARLYTRVPHCTRRLTPRHHGRPTPRADGATSRPGAGPGAREVATARPSRSCSGLFRGRGGCSPPPAEPNGLRPARHPGCRASGDFVSGREGTKPARLGLSPPGPGADFRFVPGRHSQTRRAAWSVAQAPSRAEGRPAPEEGLLLVCARPSRLDSSYRPSSPLMFWSFLMLYSFVRNQVLWLPAPSCCFRKKRGSWGWHHTQLVLFLLSRPRPARCTTLGRSNGTREPWQLGEGTDLG